jgi:hypothetical protein
LDLISTTGRASVAEIIFMATVLCRRVAAAVNGVREAVG